MGPAVFPAGATWRWHYGSPDLRFVAFYKVGSPGIAVVNMRSVPDMGAIFAEPAYLAGNDMCFVKNHGKSQRAIRVSAQMLSEEEPPVR